MLKHAAGFSKPISLELEKDRPAINELMPHADILLISKPFALSRGFSDAKQCLQYFAQKFPAKILTCTWAAWLAYQSNIFHQSAFNFNAIIEALGAGDIFNVGFISALIKQKNPQQALTFACKLAPNKCAQQGFDKLTIPH